MTSHDVDLEAMYGEGTQTGNVPYKDTVVVLPQFDEAIFVPDAKYVRDLERRIEVQERLIQQLLDANSKSKDSKATVSRDKVSSSVRDLESSVKSLRAESRSHSQNISKLARLLESQMRDYD